MKSNRLIKFRVTETQYQHIRNMAQTKGYASLAAYLRHITLKGDPMMDSIIMEIYQKIVVQDNENPKIIRSC